MRKHVAVAFVLLLCSFAWGQKDGSVVLNYGAVTFNMPVMGVEGMIGENWALTGGFLFPSMAGKFVPPTGTEPAFSLQTGPIINQKGSYHYGGGASFGPGGAFYAYYKTAEYSCLSTCSYIGTFVWSQLTQTTLTDGTYVYTLTGELVGNFAENGQEKACRAYFSMPVYDETTQLFAGNTALSNGTLQIIFEPN